MWLGCKKDEQVNTRKCINNLYWIEKM